MATHANAMIGPDTKSIAKDVDEMTIAKVVKGGTNFLESIDAVRKMPSNLYLNLVEVLSSTSLL